MPDGLPNTVFDKIIFIEFPQRLPETWEGFLGIPQEHARELKHHVVASFLGQARLVNALNQPNQDLGLSARIGRRRDHGIEVEINRAKPILTCIHTPILRHSGRAFLQNLIV